MLKHALLTLAVVLVAAPLRADEPATPFVALEGGAKAAATHRAPLILICGAADDPLAKEAADAAASKRLAKSGAAWVLVAPDAARAIDAKLARGEALVEDFDGEAVGRLGAKAAARDVEALVEKAAAACKAKATEIARVEKALAAAEKLLAARPYARAWSALAPIAALDTKPGTLGQLAAKAKERLDAIRKEVDDRAGDAERAIADGKPGPAQKLVTSLCADCQGVPELEAKAAQVKQDYGDQFSG